MDDVIPCDSRAAPAPSAHTASLRCLDSRSPTGFDAQCPGLPFTPFLLLLPRPDPRLADPWHGPAATSPPSSCPTAPRPPARVAGSHSAFSHALVVPCG